jgi:predicted transcriptional regulator of viral defense system
MKSMNWIEFKNEFLKLGCFEVNQVFAWRPDFSRDNLVRWTRRGYLVKLRKGLYAFPEFRNVEGAAAYFAGRMYRPSYVSLHTALSFYGAIPEAIVQITSVTSLKTASFRNAFGEFSFKSVRENLMFGYAPKPVGEGLFAPFATLEKALVDLLYLYPAYNSETELLELRLDEDVLHGRVDRNLLSDYLDRIGSSALGRRFGLLRQAYGI